MRLERLKVGEDMERETEKKIKSEEDRRRLTLQLNFFVAIKATSKRKRISRAGNARKETFHG